MILIQQIQNESFLSERKDDPRIKSREKSLQEFDQAYWKWREIVDNAEEGIKFYQSFGEMLGGFKGGCIQFLNSRRVDVGYVSLPLLFFFLPLSPPPHSLLSIPLPLGLISTLILEHLQPQNKREC
jgi:programmed cell death 6-interacting protein